MFRIRPVLALLSVAHGSSSGNMFYTRTYFASGPQTSAERFEGKYVWVLVRPLVPNCPAQPRPTAPCLTGQYRCCWCCICCCRCHGCGCSCCCGRAGSTTKATCYHNAVLRCRAAHLWTGHPIHAIPSQARRLPGNPSRGSWLALCWAQGVGRLLRVRPGGRARGKACEEGGTGGCWTNQKDFFHLDGLRRPWPSRRQPSISMNQGHLRLAENAAQLGHQPQPAPAGCQLDLLSAAMAAIRRPRHGFPSSCSVAPTCSRRGRGPTISSTCLGIRRRAS